MQRLVLLSNFVKPLRSKGCTVGTSLFDGTKIQAFSNNKSILRNFSSKEGDDITRILNSLEGFEKAAKDKNYDLDDLDSFPSNLPPPKRAAERENRDLRAESEYNKLTNTIDETGVNERYESVEHQKPFGAFEGDDDFVDEFVEEEEMEADGKDAEEGVKKIEHLYPGSLGIPEDYFDDIPVSPMHRTRYNIIREYGVDPVSLYWRKITESDHSISGVKVMNDGKALIRENLDELAKKYNEKKTPLENLKYFKLYPETIKKWVSNAKTPMGFYNYYGEWVSTGVNIPPAAKQEHDARKAPKPDDGVAPDLVGVYRFGVQPEEIEQYSDKMKELFSLKNAKKGEINYHRVQKAVKTFRQTDYDTGSAEVQIATMSERIRYLTEHLTKHRKDQISVRALKIMIDRRRKLMKYFKYKNGYKYMQLCKYYGIKDVPVIHKIKPSKPQQLEG